ncbi:S4 domain-containing protein YaaA [Lactobacillus nasalidis]|uniref:S4 domain-containing protein YaaA n=1 Tax=Lactobacillus nasalidis TaxID=2797258 RepID=UPI0019154929|nr:S4 domain-containing protein YaaA [Lactobacillus nasalidis]
MKVKAIETFAINGEFITLGQFLKDECIVASGGQAKWYLKDNPVLLNGASEDRRGKKLYPGDRLEVAGTEYELVQGL